MKNIKKIILVNKTFTSTNIELIKKEVTGKIIIMGASIRNEMWRTMETLSYEFGVLIRTSPLCDIEPKDLTRNHPGFKLVENIEISNEAETVIIVANSTYIAGILLYLQIETNIGIPLLGNVVKSGQVLLIHNGDFEKEVRFL